MEPSLNKVNMKNFAYVTIAMFLKFYFFLGPAFGSGGSAFGGSSSSGGGAAGSAGSFSSWR